MFTIKVVPLLSWLVFGQMYLQLGCFFYHINSLKLEESDTNSAQNLITCRFPETPSDYLSSGDNSRYNLP